MGGESSRARVDDRRGGRERISRKRLIRRRRLRALVAVVVVLGLVTVAIGAALGGESDDLASDLPLLPPESEASDPAPTRAERRARRRARDERAIERVLGYTPAVREGRPGPRQVALTFDDGPGPYTRQILEILSRHDALATFFVSGNMLASFHELAAKAERQGHAIARHAYMHPRMGLMAGLSQEAELAEVDAELRRHGIDALPLFRPPYGSFNGETLKLLAERRMLMVLWSVDTDDYTNPGVEAIVDRALAGARPGAIVLMHDAGGDRSQTVAALPAILDGLRRRDLRAVTVPELLRENPPRRRGQLPAGDLSGGLTLGGS